MIIPLSLSLSLYIYIYIYNVCAYVFTVRMLYVWARVYEYGYVTMLHI
jgi:hypothetical protein